MTNAEIAQKVFDYLKTINYKPYSLEYPWKRYDEDDNPCGIEDSMLWFRCKRVSHHWRFGMWIYTGVKDSNGNQYEPILQIFAQWDNMIDKFKPTRSALLVSFTTEQLNEDNMSNELYRLGEMLHMMRRHPLLCFYGFCGEMIGFSSESFLWYFLKHEVEYYLTRAKVFFLSAVWYPYGKILAGRANRCDCVYSCEIYNHEKRYNGMRAECIYEIQCIFKENAKKEEMQRVVSIFNKGQFGKYNHGSNCIVGCDYLKKSETDGFVDFEF